MLKRRICKICKSFLDPYDQTKFDCFGYRDGQHKELVDCVKELSERIEGLDRALEAIKYPDRMS